TPAFNVLFDVNVTVAPDTRLSNRSFTVTRRALNAPPTSAVCGVPAVAVIVAGVLDCVMPPPNEMRLVVAASGGAYRGILPVVNPVRTEPDDDRASPVGARKTCAVTGVDGSGKVAVPIPTFVHVTQSTSTPVWSTGEVKPTVRTFEEAVTADDD